MISQIYLTTSYLKIKRKEMKDNTIYKAFKDVPQQVSQTNTDIVTCAT